MNKTTNSGYTLLELVIVLAIISAIGAYSFYARGPKKATPGKSFIPEVGKETPEYLRYAEAFEKLKKVPSGYALYLNLNGDKYLSPMVMRFDNEHKAALVSFNSTSTNSFYIYFNGKDAVINCGTCNEPGWEGGKIYKIRVDGDREPLYLIE
jgi:prepilin-type N-terminal cleavage/methylation domain-containing protein